MRCLSERDEMYIQEEIFGFFKEGNMHTKRQDFGVSASALVEGSVLYLDVADMSPK
jgi:hypothetical protein